MEANSTTRNLVNLLFKSLVCELARRAALKPALTFDRVFVAAGREPSGVAAFTGHSPNGLRRSANKASAIVPISNRAS